MAQVFDGRFHSDGKRIKLAASATTKAAVALPHNSSSWSELPNDILGTILDKLTLLSDYDRFGAVCVRWRRASLDPINRTHRIEFKISSSGPNVPLLLLPPLDGGPQWERDVFDVFRKRIIVEKFKLPALPNSVGRCCGSSHGWLIFADRSVSLTLVNPFYIGGGRSCNGGIIRLPCLDRYDDQEDEDLATNLITEFYIHKAVLSADPAYDDEFVVALISISKSVAFIRPRRDTHWRSLRGTYKGPAVFVEDLIFRGNTIYTVVHGGAVYYCKITEPNPKTHKLAPSPLIIPRPPPLTVPPYYIRYYILQSLEGSLLVAYRYLDYCDQTKKFRIFKLLTLGGRRLTAWREVKNFSNNQALLLGENHSTCIYISTTSHDFQWFQPNSVYFTDDRLTNYEIGPIDPQEFFDDNGIFKLEDQSIQRCYGLNDLSKRNCMPPPVWFLPSLPGSWNRDSFNLYQTFTKDELSILAQAQGHISMTIHKSRHNSGASKS